MHELTRVLPCCFLRSAWSIHGELDFTNSLGHTDRAVVQWQRQWVGETNHILYSRIMWQLSQLKFIDINYMHLVLYRKNVVCHHHHHHE